VKFAIVDPFATAPLNVTDAWPLPAVAVIVDGALAAVCGVTADDADDATELPISFVAIAVNV
jgi:hypothetical protein